MSRRLVQLALLVLGLTGPGISLAGCGLGRKVPGGPVVVTITRDFGAHLLATGSARTGPRSTLLQLTMAASPSVTPTPTRPAPRGQTWMLVVNGIVIERGRVRTVLHPGDRVWWDLHTLTPGVQVRAAVGAYPEPFIHGAAGKRLPTTLECAADVPQACSTVRRALEAIGIPSTSQVLGAGSGTDSLGVVVGTARDLRAQVVTVLVSRGPQDSGVFARFTGGGRQLELLDAAGRVRRVLSRGAGLVAATSDQFAEPTWLITGTDPQGVGTASAALSAAILRRRFALAVRGDQRISVPLR